MHHDRQHRFPWIWIALGVGIGFAVLCVCCGGPCAYNVYDGFTVMDSLVEDELRQNARFRERLGELESAEMNFMKTGDAARDVMVYDVKGSKGSGTLQVEFDSSRIGYPKIRWMKLESQGETVEIYP
jgi:hypothetical protein